MLVSFNIESRTQGSNRKKTANNKDVDHCYTKHLLRWDIEGQKMPNEKSCRKANGTKQTWDKIFAPGACPTELEIDDPTATVICPLQYPDGASISQTSISSSSVQERVENLDDSQLIISIHY